MGSIDTASSDSSAQPRSRIEDAATGLVIIAIGLAFLAGNLGFHLPFQLWHDWWALFILIGALSQAGKAFARFQAIGTVDAVVARRLLSAGVTTMIALFFLLDVSFAVWWPVFLVIGGLYLLVPGRRKRDRGSER